tara:strand:- start:2239 stop:3228 length:990 start_codon:yes stop_codon:yes gene_type:complete
LSQGLIGVALPQSFSKKKFVRLAGIFGFFSGMFPDFDIFIRSSEDPLLFLEFHRQFTHSLIFIPLGGLVCSVLFFLILGRRQNCSFRQTYFYCSLGYGTHALLDACTSYGTLLFWPFSYERISWNNISIIDPLFTIPIFIFLFIAFLKKKRKFSRIALAWAILYLALGIFFRNAAIDMGKDIATRRGHFLVQVQAKPSIGNIFLWKTIYENSGKYYVDAVRTGPYPKIFLGESIAKLNLKSSFLWLKNNSQQSKDIDRFRWFSNGYLAQDKKNKNRIIDVRYSMIPNRIEPLWSIELSKSADFNAHVSYKRSRSLSRKRIKLFLEMLWG